jgi:hypothetical protein
MLDGMSRKTTSRIYVWRSKGIVVSFFGASGILTAGRWLLVDRSAQLGEKS